MELHLCSRLSQNLDLLSFSLTSRCHVGQGCMVGPLCQPLIALHTGPLLELARHTHAWLDRASKLTCLCKPSLAAASNTLTAAIEHQGLQERHQYFRTVVLYTFCFGSLSWIAAGDTGKLAAVLLLCSIQSKGSFWNLKTARDVLAARAVTYIWGRALICK